jgi:hypothetical protein
MRFFNTAGPVNCQDHYCLPPLQRLALDEVLSLIQQKKYFVLHAPRQTGKTSCLLALMDYLNQEGQYRALYVNVETGQSAREDVRRGMQAILAELASGAQYYLRDPFLQRTWRQTLEEVGEHAALNAVLTRWCEANPQPLILLVDEIDALVGDTLISVLRQLRAGYPKRPAGFPQSIVLCGVRDVRDYRIHSDREKMVITGGSAFTLTGTGNIKAESLRLGDFSREIANPIYREIIPRALTSVTQDMLAQETAWYLRPDGRLDLPKLLAAFQQFFREHSESWIERFDYKEAGPQLLMQAFLQRIVNEGGRVEREYGLGRRRTDLLVIWPYAGGAQRAVIELKLRYKRLEETIAEGLAQTWEYADRCGASEAHLVIFDRDPAKPWDEKIFRREETYQGTRIAVWGM